MLYFLLAIPWEHRLVTSDSDLLPLCFDASQDAPMREGKGVDRPDGLTPPSVLSFTDMVEKTRYQIDGTKSRYGA